MSRTRTRTTNHHRRTARVVAGALAAVTCVGLVAAEGRPVGSTEAEMTDSEFVSTNGMGYWPTYYANISAGSAKSSNPAYTTNNTTYVSNMTFRMGNTGTSASGGAATGSNNGPYVARWDQFWRPPAAGSATDPDHTNYVDDTNPTHFNGVTLDPVGNDPRNWKAYANFNNGGDRQNPNNVRCLYGSADYKVVTEKTNQCKIGSGNLTGVTNNTAQYGFMWSNGQPDANNKGGNWAFLNAAGVTTAVRCGPTGAVADPPGGRVDIGEGALNNGDPFLNYSAGDSKRWKSVVEGGAPGKNNGIFTNNKLTSWMASGANGVMRAMPIIRNEVNSAGNHALSEVAIYAEFYLSPNGNINDTSRYVLKNKMYFIISRSECGVRRQSDTVHDAALPATTPGIEQLTMPGGNGLTPYPTSTTYTPAAQAARTQTLRRAPEGPLSTEVPTATTEPSTSAAEASPTPATSAEATATSTTPPEEPATTTRESGVASTTGAQTTTSAPPTIPARPEPLSASEVTTVCAPVDIDGRSTEMLVKGTECPADAASGAAALSAHAGGTTVTDPAWKVFTSTDPDQDGWRHAAVEQTTGAVLYVR